MSKPAFAPPIPANLALRQSAADVGQSMADLRDDLHMALMDYTHRTGLVVSAVRVGATARVIRDPKLHQDLIIPEYTIGVSVRMGRPR